MDLHDPRADVVADVLGASLIRHVLYRPLEAHAPWGLRMPRRERASFYLVARGSARLEVEGERARVLGPSEIAFVPHGTAHVLRDALDTEPLPVCDGPLSPSLLPRRFGGRGASSTLLAGFFTLGDRTPMLLRGMPRVVVLTPQDPVVAATVQLAIRESAAPQPASSVVLQRLFDVLFVMALRATSDREQSVLGAFTDPRIYEALGLMHTRVEHPWTVNELARRVGMSRSGFAARFGELVGEPPLQYLARWRVARAAELLRDTGEKVATIAARVGYESVPSFSRAFKRWQRASPVTFRRDSGSGVYASSV